MPSRPVIVNLKDEGSPETGREYEVESVAVAKKLYPEGKVVRFADSNEPYSEDAPQTEAQARRAAADAAKAAASE